MKKNRGGGGVGLPPPPSLRYREKRGPERVKGIFTDFIGEKGGGDAQERSRNRIRNRGYFKRFKFFRSLWLLRSINGVPYHVKLFVMFFFLSTTKEPEVFKGTEFADFTWGSTEPCPAQEYGFSLSVFIFSNTS